MTEQPSYTIIQKQGNFEVRKYAPYIKAEVDIVESSYRDAIYKGFRILADFIFGNNIKTEKIDMTSPVQVSQSEKIAMTTPVTISGEGTYTVAFIMPSKFTLENLPKPKNPAIRFTEVESQTMASFNFSGFYRQNRVEKAKKELQRWIEEKSIASMGEFIIAGYDPPWVPWFLAQNEVMIPIKDGV